MLKSFKLVSSKFLLISKPALLINISTEFQFLDIYFLTIEWSSSLVISNDKKVVFSKFNFSVFFIFLDRDNTLNPALENILINSRPIPLLVPVIITFFDIQIKLV